ncbi:MAG: DNA-protecting protein DprA [Acidobacteria bacterium]|nr:DNA-protecting protein DprA [Acidobacteriota bacterium]
MRNSHSAFAIMRLLQLPGVGNARLRALFDFARRTRSSVTELIHEPNSLNGVLSASQARELQLAREAVSEVWEKLEQENIAVFSILDNEYPAVLREVLGKQAPPLLFLRGNQALMKIASLGFCGSRKPSERGLAVARECSAMVSKEGINVVSGYAAGVDVTTHRTSLEVGGSTIIILPEGIFHFRIRRDLKDVWDWNRILIVSQYLPTAGWSIHNAMQRNSTICALCKAMVLIEASETGGSIEAGRTCLKLGIPLFAPVYEGMPDSARGNQLLTREGARSLYKSKTTQMPNLGPVLAAFRQAPQALA